MSTMFPSRKLLQNVISNKLHMLSKSKGPVPPIGPTAKYLQTHTNPPYSFPQLSEPRHHTNPHPAPLNLNRPDPPRPYISQLLHVSVLEHPIQILASIRTFGLVSKCCKADLTIQPAAVYAQLDEREHIACFAIRDARSQLLFKELIRN